MAQVSDQQYFKQFVVEVKAMIRAAQYRALQAVNRELIDLYWNLGRLITERQEQYRWGKRVVENLSKELQLEFPGESGYSAGNLWRMRNFYSLYHSSEILAPMAREIGWTHNYVIFEKCKDALQREFCNRMTRKYGWTKAVLIHHIENQSYEKYLNNQTNFDQTVPEQYRLWVMPKHISFKFTQNFNLIPQCEILQPLVAEISCHPPPKFFLPFLLNLCSKNGRTHTAFKRPGSKNTRGAGSFFVRENRLVVAARRYTRRARHRQNDVDAATDAGFGKGRLLLARRFVFQPAFAARNGRGISNARLLTGVHTAPAISLDNLISGHENISMELCRSFRPLEHFGVYLREGYYPFFLENR